MDRFSTCVEREREFKSHNYFCQANELQCQNDGRRFHTESRELVFNRHFVFQTLSLLLKHYFTTHIYTMVADMSYSTVSNVIDSWEEVRRLKDYEKVVGVTLFTKYVN